MATQPSGDLAEIAPSVCTAELSASAAKDTTCDTAKLTDTLAVHILNPAGNGLFSGEMPLCATFEDLILRVKLDSPQRQYSLIHGGNVLGKGSAVLGDVLTPPEATLTLIKGPLKVPAAGIRGAHTNNASYFKYVNEDTPDAYLELRQVCWFQVGATFEEVPEGSYQVVIEAARTDSLSLKGNSFGARVRASGTWSDLEKWDAESSLTTEFQEFNIGEVVVGEGGSVQVELNIREGGWVQGFLWKSVSLK
mmetsp:Transcript_8214/g.17026  ORF Transcript_8214/g.17026 Transcript_8214/m.17026 type:complete len:250 (-) Transcript_8214:173-922(-)